MNKHLLVYMEAYKYNHISSVLTSRRCTECELFSRYRTLEIFKIVTFKVSKPVTNKNKNKELLVTNRIVMHV